MGDTGRGHRLLPRGHVPPYIPFGSFATETATNTMNLFKMAKAVSKINCLRLKVTGYH